jgi:ribosome-associated heat shock protein Hsp15
MRRARKAFTGIREAARGGGTAEIIQAWTIVTHATLSKMPLAAPRPLASRSASLGGEQAMSQGKDREAIARLRIDKWLWAARFFKTRSLAQEAVEAGRVRLNGERVKPGREVKPGDELAIQVGDLAWTVKVEALSDRRGPAPAARQLYSEDAGSREARQQRIEARQWQADPGSGIRGRPSKRDRRLLRRFTE